MAMAAGVSIDAALAHGLVGVRRRPRDPVRIAFAALSLAVAAGALAIVVMYTTVSPRTHYQVMKWVFFPAGVAWSLSTVWLVAYYTGVRPLRWLLPLSAGFGALIVLDLVLPYGVLHREVGTIASLHMAGANVSVMAVPAPHPIYYLVSAVDLAAFVFMFTAAWRVYRRGERRKAWLVAAILALFLVAGVLDALQDYGVLTDLYYTQLSFVALVFGVSIGLREESLRQEAGERLATAESLRRRVAELDSLQRIAQTLAGRTELGPALDDACRAITDLFTARSATVNLVSDEAGPAAGSAEQLAAQGTAHLLLVPLMNGSELVGVLSIARGESSAAFTDGDRQLALTVADALAAAIEIDRLHREATKEAAEEERQRLARDLHDAVTQSVYSASLIAEALPAVWRREPEEGLRSLETLRRLMRAALSEMRTLLLELRPATLDATPLDALLQRLGDSLSGQAQIPVDVQIDESVSLPHDVKIVFYRVAQEAFSNIGKHARATRVTAVVRARGAGAMLTVRDDGTGFDPGAVTADHMGLRIMQERLDRVDASLAVDSAQGRGTTVTVIWPRPGAEEQQRQDKEET